MDLRAGDRLVVGETELSVWRDASPPTNHAEPAGTSPAESPRERVSESVRAAEKAGEQAPARSVESPSEPPAGGSSAASDPQSARPDLPVVRPKARQTQPGSAGVAGAAATAPAAGAAAAPAAGGAGAAGKLPPDEAPHAADEGKAGASAGSANDSQRGPKKPADDGQGDTSKFGSDFDWDGVVAELDLGASDPPPTKGTPDTNALAPSAADQILSGMAASPRVGPHNPELADLVAQAAAVSTAQTAPSPSPATPAAAPVGPGGRAALPSIADEIELRSRPGRANLTRGASDAWVRRLLPDLGLLSENVGDRGPLAQFAWLLAMFVLALLLAWGSFWLFGGCETDGVQTVRQHEAPPVDQP